jgi:hypothetical protein
MLSIQIQNYARISILCVKAMMESSDMLNNKSLECVMQAFAIKSHYNRPVVTVFVQTQ